MPNPEIDGGDLERERLEFDREKWRAEDSARRDELALKRGELDRSRWVNPLVIAILAAAVAALGNAAVTSVNSYQQAQLETEKAKLNRDLEQTKSEAARILEVVKTNDPDNAAVNLKFLMDVGLITDKDTSGKIQTYLATREQGKGVSLPAGGASAEDLKAELKNMPPQVFITTTTSMAGIEAGNGLEKELREIGMTIVNREARDPAQIGESKVSCYGVDSCKDAKMLVPLLRCRGYVLGDANMSSRAEDNSDDMATTLYNSKIIRIVLLDPKSSQPAASAIAPRGAP